MLVNGIKNTKLSPHNDSGGLTSKTFAGITWTYFATISQALLQILVLAILARLLSPREFGLYSITLLFTTLVERVGHLGIGPALVQRKEITKEDISIGFSYAVIMGLIIYTLMYFGAGELAKFFAEPELKPLLRAAGFIFLVDSLNSIPESILQRSLRFKDLTRIELSAYLLGNGLTAIVLAYFEWGTWSLIAGAITSRFIKAALFHRHVSPSFTLKLFSGSAPDLLKMGLGFSTGRILNYAALNGDNFIVGRILGATPLGLYSRSYQLMALPANSIGQILDRVLFPAMAKRQTDKKALTKILLIAIETVALISMPACVFMYITSQEIILTLFGRSWTEAIPVLQLLSLGVFFRAAYKASDTLARAVGGVFSLAGRQAIYTLTILSGAWFGATYYGLNGVAIAVLIGVGVNYLLLIRLSKHILGFSMLDFFLAHLPAFWASIWVAAATLITASVTRHFQLFPTLGLGLCAVSAAIGLIVGLAAGPKSCRISFWKNLEEKLKFSRFGTPGRVVNWTMSHISK